jgi:hypothetical protein
MPVKTKPSIGFRGFLNPNANLWFEGVRIIEKRL